MTNTFNPSKLKKTNLKPVREDNDIRSYRIVDGIKMETVESFLQRGGTIEKAQSTGLNLDEDLLEEEEVEKEAA
ncbi:MAG: hypothetical protein EP319_06380 [Deltaproteobacteria bacterium]|nr:MAG: hypothetical protein EP319_06380 [Deltaproteobacteria bacterium]